MKTIGLIVVISILIYVLYKVYQGIQETFEDYKEEEVLRKIRGHKQKSKKNYSYNKPQVSKNTRDTLEDYSVMTNPDKGIWCRPECVIENPQYSPTEKTSEDLIKSGLPPQSVGIPVYVNPSASFEYSKTNDDDLRLIRSGTGFLIYNHKKIKNGSWAPCRIIRN